MKFEIENNFLDLGTTPIENMFINTFLSRANDVQIKVYLYALSNAYSGKTDLTNENIAREMGLTEGQVVDAWQYWIDEGVVERKNDSYIFKSIRFQYIDSMYDITGENYISKTTDSPESDQELYDNSEEAVQSRTLIENIEEFISSGSDTPIQLDPREIRKVLQTMNDFNVTPDFMSYAYMMASNVRGIKAVDPIMATIRNWMIDGATDMEKLELYLTQKSEAKEEKKVEKQNYSSEKPNKDSLAASDNRMTREERLKFVQDKMKRKLPIKKKRED
ncbi:hypothetical protein ACWOAQ_02810 [Helcococcus kunzii]|uniref:DnaD domain-containing protein n=1 Tax=Helcococcus kunzii ATCC 51366 TaxID=883114 RepID=H3NLR7_9FIRM|nr:hypothetical protein [Helcococcus kunzii]EHR35724.1 hypothetical protein HMPREF9709_00278 [Helcococcus kunzii ATCC 51366]MCT1796265.1 hypothetical protein [Helcococcus kunzii]MCT1989123.1 hypothetical protein [Helcococcus kunzii]QUY64207.1 hypothetical protein GUI37_01220 [Helcococcus kunzii]QZO76663.1 hypothetical protein HIF96_01155 [Helcococcus kunzii]